jgi:predicted ATPase/DNA-binding winged helix-turn-helix (wHTH) protein
MLKKDAQRAGPGERAAQATDHPVSDRASACNYRFARFELQPSERRLLSAGEPTEVGPRAFDLLVALVTRAGELVTKDDLLALVWPNLIVEENNLQVQVSALRKILGQDAIATITGRGYRFTPVPQLVAPQASNVTPVRTHNLPQLLTSFIGHENDLADYARILERTRLLTLTGIGGCGKTRLAIELARMVLRSFPDGVWFVDLAPVAEAERVATVVATTLDVREEVNQPVEETLARHLAGRQLLLVLDNCEHVLAACATLVERLLMAASGVRALITSREGLGIAGERLVPVRSLAFPPPGSAPDPEAMATFEAVRLFVDRARQVASSFALNASNASAIAEICRQLDGIPLALELAAARVKLLSVDQIRAKLDDRFRLLTRSARALSRHQTLLATLQWSYDHLTPDQRQLLRRLSVFVGGWTLEGAVHVASDQPDEYAVLDLLTRLVDQSLVVTHGVEDGASRYSMLETVRQYAHEQLNEASEGSATRTRHLDFYVALAEQAASELAGQRQAAWLARLDLERENLLAAHAWCDDAEEFAGVGLRLVCSLQIYWLHRGLTTLGHRVTVRALTRDAAQGRNLARCKTLHSAGEFSYLMGRYREAKDYAETSLSISRELGDEGRAAEALRVLGYVALDGGDKAVARAYFQEALALSRQVGDKRRLSRALIGLAAPYVAAGELDQAEPLYEEALALDRERGDGGRIVISLANLAMISTLRGSGDRASAMLREGFSIAAEIGLKWPGVQLLSGTTKLAAHFGDWRFAARLEGATESLSREMGNQPEPAEHAVHGPFIATTREALGAVAFAAAELSGRALSYEEATAEARSWLEQRP